MDAELLIAEGEQLAGRIERREALAASRAAAREAADEGRIIKSRTLPELTGELERCLTMIAEHIDDQDARLAALEATGGPADGDGDRPFPMLGRSAFAKHDATAGVEVLRELVRELATTVRAERRRVDDLEARLNATQSNFRRGILQ